MRAILIADQLEKESGKILIEGEHARHLIKVVRIKSGEQIKILNGLGCTTLCEVVSVESKKLTLNILKVDSYIQNARLDLALGIPKKEAFEDVVKAACEIGLGRVIPVKTEFSQYTPKRSDRLNKLMESGLIQSNNPFFLALEETVDFKDLLSLFSSYDKVLYFCSHQNFSVKNSLEIKKTDKVLIIIGPEGGLSEREEEQLNALKNVFFINLPTYILRTPTAVSLCCGWVLAKMPI